MLLILTSGPVTATKTLITCQVTLIRQPVFTRNQADLSVMACQNQPVVLITLITRVTAEVIPVNDYRAMDELRDELKDLLSARLNQCARNGDKQVRDDAHAEIMADVDHYVKSIQADTADDIHDKLMFIKRSWFGRKVSYRHLMESLRAICERFEV